jgi:hypothetical protein
VLAPELVVRESTLRRAAPLLVLDGGDPADSTAAGDAPASALP